MRGVRRGKSTGGHLRSEIVRGKSGRTNCRRATKLGPKVRLFKTPVRIVLQPDRARAARANSLVLWIFDFPLHFRGLYHSGTEGSSIQYGNTDSLAA